MSRYFFNFHDGENVRDLIGSEHPDMDSVRSEAVGTIAELLRGRLLKTRDVSSYVINVTNESGVTVLILSLSAAVQVFLPQTPVPAL